MLFSYDYPPTPKRPQPEDKNQYQYYKDVKEAEKELDKIAKGAEPMFLMQAQLELARSRKEERKKEELIASYKATLIVLCLTHLFIGLCVAFLCIALRHMLV